MSILEYFVTEIQIYLTSNTYTETNIIRKHTKHLDKLGDVSFPINMLNWNHLLNGTYLLERSKTIFDYKNAGNTLDEQCEQLIEASKNWKLSINKIVTVSQNIHIFLERSSCLFANVLQEVLSNSKPFGTGAYLNKNYRIKISTIEKDISECDLTILRLQILKNVANNFINQFSAHKDELPDCDIQISLNQKLPTKGNILCGPILNESGAKTSLTTNELYKKRACDMRMMAQHKYGIQIKKLESWENYFYKLGVACATIEILSNKPQKSIKITLNSLETGNKGAAFIFYNCARIATLLKEFDKRVQNKIYPELPQLEDIDFSSIKQPEEWELFYVYILQYPILTKSCIKDIENGYFNPHYLVAFLSNLCSLFSTYYRRIRILTDPRDHLFSILHARIYLLKGLQYVFHNALSFMNIDPVKEM